MHAEIDDALIALFEGRPGADERLMAFGPDAFHRVMSLYTTIPDDYPPRLVELVAQLRRESLERWAHAISAVAWANPGLYVDQLGEPGTLDVVILGDIDDPRVVGVLRRALDSPEWLIRYHAVRSLAKRQEPEARQHLELALTDAEETVRQEAERALRRPPGP
jgi:HEAT repeat protein